MNEKLEKLMKEIDSYHNEIMSFKREDGTDFIPAIYKPKEKGYYITLRCGYGGIYQIVNEWDGNDWMINATDGSFTIAYSREPIELKNVEK